MRLTKLKLSGFKSFVDPTTVLFPGNLGGIVGPNGCGKSNIIDAARWVLGESKASELRGESIQDVIFKGSGTRKEVSRASVELFFDNADGKAAGQWSQYAEITVRRVLDRDGNSNYYINNLNVRRRDVIDLFLGTGLGPRSYAIIGQGMISRIIESKPDELRGFLARHHDAFAHARMLGQHRFHFPNFNPEPANLYLLVDAPEGPFSTNIFWDRAIAAARLFGLSHMGQWFDVGTPASIGPTEAALTDG